MGSCRVNVPTRATTTEASFRNRPFVMNVLVTGSSGFTGSALVKSLLQHGFNVSTFDRVPVSYGPDVNGLLGDIRNLEDVQEAVQGQDLVYHLADVLGNHKGVTNARHLLDVNVGGTVNVLESCRVHGARLLLASTPDVSVNTYSITKEAAERFSKMYMAEYGVITTIVKWSNAFGPGQKVGPGYVQRAVPTLVVNALEGKRLLVIGNGEQTADFMYIDDLVEATIAVAQSRLANGRTVEIGTGIETSMLQVCEMILGMTGSSSRIEYQPIRPGETASTESRADIRLLKETTGFVPQTSLESGLQQTVAYYRQMFGGSKASLPGPAFPPSNSANGEFSLPSEREMEVLRLLALGLETKEIANELQLSSHTVLNHIRNVREKLRAPTRLAAVLAAQRLGLL